ncbi:hypothetical protein BDV09DRAFT_14375 [Aspergillus tetrazonus]
MISLVFILVTLCHASVGSRLSFTVICLVTRTAFSGISRCIWSSDSAQSLLISARLWILPHHFNSYVPGMNDGLGHEDSPMFGHLEK